MLRNLWFKTSVYGLGAVLAALLAIVIAPYVPKFFADFLGDDAVEGILKILASSMLAVATFSLGTMVAAFAAASSMATPRASKLLVEDPLSQNVLSTFIGAFIFSLVGLIALSTGVYGPGGRFVLFMVTILVTLTVLMTFFRWIDYLSNLGQLSSTLNKVESAAYEALKQRGEYPFLKANPLEEVPSSAFAHFGKTIGYIQHIDVNVLEKAAEKARGFIWINRIPGHWTDEALPLFWTSWHPDSQTHCDLYKAFSIDGVRSFDQDPRFGIIVLSEIASRALSPGINDPGTAIDVIGRITRLLSKWGQTRAINSPPKYRHVYVRSITVEDIFEDAFGPIARDGAKSFEVNVRLQKALASLSITNPELFAQQAAKHSKLALALSDEGLTLEEHKRALRELAIS